MYNLSAPFVIQFFWDKLSKVLEYVDILFSNESEARVLGEKMGWGVCTNKHYIKIIEKKTNKTKKQKSNNGILKLQL